MSMENVKQFLELVKTDEGLARKVVELKDSLQGGAGAGNEKEILAEKVLPLAMQHGIEFNVDDFISFADSQMKNLSKEELLTISGGKISRAPALGLLFAAGLAFAPSAMGNIPNLPLFEHVAEAATTAEEVEQELVESITALFTETDLSVQDDAEAFELLACGTVQQTLQGNGIKVQVDKENSKVFHCTKDGETFDINVDNLIERAKQNLTPAEEITNYVKTYLKDAEEAAPPGDPPQISICEIRENVKEKFADIIGKTFDRDDLDKLISKAIKDLFVSAVKSRAVNASVFDKEEAIAVKALMKIATTWLNYRHLHFVVPIDKTPAESICCYNLSSYTKPLFEVNFKDLFNENSKKIQPKVASYKALDRRKDSWKNIVEALLTAIYSANFDLNNCSQDAQNALKNDLKWFAGYIKGDLGSYYCQGWNPFDTYGSGKPTDKITAQISVLKAFIEEGFNKGENTQNAIRTLANFSG